MIAAAVVALAGIILVATGTPRQAAQLFGGRLDRTRRRAARLAGWLALTVSLGTALIGADRARHLIAWIGTIGVEALVVALALTLWTSRART